jgi:hypothetical protein
MGEKRNAYRLLVIKWGLFPLRNGRNGPEKLTAPEVID